MLILTDVEESKKAGPHLVSQEEVEIAKANRDPYFPERSPQQICRDEVFLGLTPRQVQSLTREGFLEASSNFWKGQFEGGREQGSWSESDWPGLWL